MAAVVAVENSKVKRKRFLLRTAACWFLFIYRKGKKTQSRSVWTRPWLLRREELGAYDTLLSELKVEDQASFLNFLRLTPGLFEEMVEKVAPYIQREDTCFRKAISAGMRLAITLRFLATGETFKSLAYLFRVANNTIGKIVPETCLALYKVLQPDYFQCPTTLEEWELVARDYMELWNFPNCIGALDGKHVAIKQPACSGSKFFNYKHHFSIVLLALVDAHYRFLFVDIGGQGRCSDAGIFQESVLQDALSSNSFGVPPPTPVPGRQDNFPYVIVADDAFPLRHYLMKPYPHRNLTRSQRNFNYRLSRARRCVENAFGIMANRFRVLLNPICLAPKKVDVLVLACCALHNMLRTIAPNKYVHPDDTDNIGGNNTRRAQLPGAKVSCRRTMNRLGKEYREYLCEYFTSPEGSIRWPAGSE